MWTKGTHNNSGENITGIEEQNKWRERQIMKKICQNKNRKNDEIKWKKFQNFRNR